MTPSPKHVRIQETKETHAQVLLREEMDWADWFSRGAYAVLSLFLALLVPLIMIIIGFTAYRINFDLYALDPQLYAEVLIQLGSAFLNAAALSAGGAFTAVKLLPKLLSKLTDDASPSTKG